MTRALISDALAKASAYNGDIICSLAKASVEDHPEFRAIHLNEALKGAQHVLRSIQDAITAENEAKPEKFMRRIK